jgi:hypothetical protein
MLSGALNQPEPRPRVRICTDAPHPPTRPSAESACHAQSAVRVRKMLSARTSASSRGARAAGPGARQARACARRARARARQGRPYGSSRACAYMSPARGGKRRETECAPAEPAPRDAGGDDDGERGHGRERGGRVLEVARQLHARQQLARAQRRRARTFIPNRPATSAPTPMPIVPIETCGGVSEPAGAREHDAP